MPVILPAPRDEKIMLYLPTDEDPSQEAFVRVRYATIAEETSISKFAARHETQFLDSNGLATFKSDFSQLELQRMRAYLTLADCNISLPSESEPTNPDKATPIFTFQRIAGAVRVNMTEDEFNQAWGKLPTEWASAIVKAVLEVNKQWNPAVRPS